MRQLTKSLCIIAACILSTGATAQNYMGVATSQWNTLGSMYLNPASLGGCKERVSVQLLSLNLGVDNSLGSFTGLNNLFKSNDGDSSSDNVFNIDKNKKYFNMLLPALEMRGPGVVVGFNKKHTVAVTTRIRMMNQLNHFDKSIYDEVTNPETPTGNYSLSAQNFNWTAHLWSEIGASYGGIVFDDESIGQVKVGITLRHLSGVGYIGLRGGNMDITYTSGADSFYAKNADLHFASNLISSKSALFQGIDGSTLFSNLFGGGAGSGFGADIGVSFSRKFYYNDTKSDDEGHNLTASLSIVDMGSIKYKKDNHTLDITGKGYLDGKKLGDYKNDIDSIKAYAQRQGFLADTGSNATKVHMPTALIIGADYEIINHLALNVTYIANIVNRQKFGNSVYNRLSITPRFDSKVFSVGMPITFSSLAKDVKVGLGMRLGGFVLGSDDMLAFFSNNKYGMNVYFGFHVPIYKKDRQKPKKESGVVDMLH